jgi:hypothetical protein
MAPALDVPAAPSLIVIAAPSMPKTPSSVH